MMMPKFRKIKECLRRRIHFCSMLMLIYVILVLKYNQPITFLKHYFEQYNYMAFVSSAKEADLQDPWVNKHEYVLYLNEERICANDPFLLVSIISAPENQDIRRTIRKTYGTLKMVHGLTVQFIFLLGATADEGSSYINPRIKQESETYHDIIKGDFIDHYKNLTRKTVMGLYWFNRYCRRAKYVIKIDDDTVLNIYKVVFFLLDLERNNKVSNFLYGSVYFHIPPVRDVSSKYYVNYIEYPYKYFPDFCAGPGYMFSNDVGVALYKASTKVPFLFLEDVFIAFCAELSRIPLTHNFFGFYLDINNFWWIKYPSDWVVLMHVGRDIQLWNQLWNEFFSSPAKHSIKYYETLKSILIVSFLFIVCMFVIAIKFVCMRL